MKKYSVPIENGREGRSRNGLRAEINLGLKKGYEGFAQEKGEVLEFLTGLYVKAGEEGKNFVPFVVTDSVITYAYPTDKGWVAAHEPGLVLTSDKSPLYAAEMSDEEWKELVEWFAAQLGSKFQQFRVYVTYTRTEEVKILQRES